MQYAKTEREGLLAVLLVSPSSTRCNFGGFDGVNCFLCNVFLIHTLIVKTLAVYHLIGAWFKSSIPLFKCSLSYKIKMSKHVSELLDGYVHIIVVEIKCITSKFYPHNSDNR